MSKVTPSGVSAVSEYSLQDLKKITKDEVRKSERNNKAENAIFYESFQNEKKELADEIVLLNDRISKMDDKIDSSRSSNIEIIGIFVALFTFISIDINILRLPLSLISLVGFVLVTLGSLLFFVTLIKTQPLKEDGSFFTSYLFVTLIFLIAGVVLIFLGNEKESKYIFIEKDNDKYKYVLIKDDMSDEYSSSIKSEISSSSNTINLELLKLKKCLSEKRYLSQECLK